MIPRLPTLLVLCAAVSQPVLTPEGISADIDKRGAKAVIKTLDSTDIGDQTQWASVVAHIMNGEKPWIDLAPKLAPATKGDEMHETDLPEALAHALTINAETALSIVTENKSDKILRIDIVCSAPFAATGSVEEANSYLEDYKRKAIAAVESARAHYPRRADRCLKTLKINPLTPKDISANITLHGATAFLGALSRYQSGMILKHIDKGDADWIALVPALAPGTYGSKGDNEEWHEAIAQSLGRALPENAEAVLAILTDDPKNYDYDIDAVCSGSWDNMPTIGWVRDYKEKAIAAVTAIRDSHPKRADRCLQNLQELPKP